jgi:choline kinase
MRAIIIAAGRGSRLGSITDHIPKPLVKVNGMSILGRQISLLNEMGVEDVIIVTGYKRDAIKFENVKYVVNGDYSTTEQLFSLMTARSFFSGELIVAYGDIIYDRKILEKIVNCKDDFLLAVDKNWEKSYEKRQDNSAILADFIGLNKGKVSECFTNLNKDNIDFDEIVEFIGLIKLSSNASSAFLRRYLAMEEFDKKSVEKMKLIVFFESLRKNKVNISTFNVKNRWFEIDTQQDLEIARKLFK